VGKKQDRRYQLRFESDLAIEAVRLQYRRCVDETHPECERSRFDIDFYVVALWRLREAARMTRDRVHDERMRGPLKAFEAELPHLKGLRDKMTHTDPDREFVQHVTMFSDEVLRLQPGGVEYLLQLERAQPEAEMLYEALCDVLGELPG
jgi:hypothetical protein